MGISKNQHKEVASLKLSVYYDVFNDILTRVKLFSSQVSDKSCAVEQVVELPENVIAVYDRGYGSQSLAFLHDHYKKKYVIRIKLAFSNIVKDFVKSTDNELIVTEKLSTKTLNQLLALGITIIEGAVHSYRLVKVVLSTGEIEVLMTNLDNTFTINDLKKIYSLRWGIEGAFKVVKSIQMLGTFSGYSKIAILQDIWCNLIFFNLQTISSLEAKKEAQKVSKKRKKASCQKGKKMNKKYKINRNIGANTLRNNIIKLFQVADNELGNLLNKMTIIYSSSLEMCKKTNKPRESKKLRQNARHVTEMNYKQAF